jgi:hypothetical protein
MAIVYEEIQEEPVSLLDPEGNLVCIVKNVLEFYHVRVQIKEQNLEGYKFVKGEQNQAIDRNGEVYPIDKNSKGYFHDLFPMSTQLLLKLI